MTNEQLTEREQRKGGNYMLVDDTFKSCVLSEEEIKRRIGIYLLYNFNKEESKNGEFKTFDMETYNFYNWYLYEKEDTQQLRDSINDIIKTSLTDDIVNNIYDLYKELAFNSNIQIIRTLSRLLYIQHKYKDDEIGQQLDEIIKVYIDSVKNIDTEDIIIKDKTLEELEIIGHKITARNLFYIIPSLNYDIHRYKKYECPFMSLWIKGVNRADLVGFLGNFLNNVVEDSTRRIKTSDDINDYINKIINTRQFNEFLKANDDVLRDIIKEYKEINGNNDTTLRLLVSLKDKQNIDDLLDEDIEKQINDPLLNKIYDIYTDYQITSDYLKYQLTSEDIDNWHNKANDFISHLQEKKDATFNDFDLDYTLKHLAYNDYQIKTYKTGKKPDYETPNKPKRLTKQQLKAKYQEETLLNGEELNPNKKWAIIDTNKLNNNIMNIRETIGKKVDSNTDITQRKINEIKKKAKPTKKDLEKLEELKETLKQQQEDNKALENDIIDLKDDIDLINKQIGTETDGNEIKRLIRIRKAKEKELKAKQDIFNKNGLVFQLNVDGKLTYEKENKRKKERYKLIVNADYDVTNFNQEGRNFIQYIPNIPNVVNELDNDYITIDLDHYVDFNGISNPQRTRKRLQATLIEMRKESYEYSFYDDKGALQEGSLVLIGDVMSTEYKGKATIKVQLGGQFKRNIQQAIIKGNIAHVNKEVFKIGHGKNNKKEYMARELYFYFVRLARTEAKKGLTKGTYQKALKLDTIITFLAEINLINYNPNRYNETVKEPLQTALYMGQELGLFSIKTDAFKYYDDVINTLNNGANVKDKVKTFESQLIQITLYNDNTTDLTSNEKAHKTYKENQKKYNKRATKK
jgi:hypothetical protein